MPYCPNCRTEYRLGFTRCSDCDAALVESLPDAEPEAGTNTAIELVELATFPDEPEAEMIRELLEDNGITGVLRNDMGAGIAPAGLDITLLVDRQDEERARALYQEYFAGDEAAEAAEQADDDPRTKEETP